MTKKNKTKLLLFIVLALFISGGSVASYWYFIKPNKSASKVKDAQIKQVEKKDSETAKSSDNKNSNQDTKPQAQSTPASSAVSVTISSSGATEGTVYINALVVGSTSGTCKLTMQNGSATITKTVGVGLQVSYYICQGFSIATNEFVSKGDWSAFIEISTPNGTAKSDTRKVTIQ